ncbi:MAG: M3 family metallopeptidase [Armatimonadota bacterium]|nr:M3 family metallopeptidase [Armatimonadota bacterium]
MSLTIEEFQTRLEGLEVELNRETCRQYAGWPYDEARMEALSRQIEALARDALAALPPEAFPRPLHFAALRAAAASTYTRLDNEIYRLRSEAVQVAEGDEVVTLSTWRRFNHRHARDRARRRRVFDGLLEQARVLTPLLAERMALSRRVFAPLGLTPLDVYLEEEGVDAATLRGLVERTARAAYPAFRAELDAFAAELLGGPAEYYDDFYVFGHVIYAPVDPAVAALDVPALVGEVCRRLGFDLARITVDAEPRPGKHASPVCFGVHIPHEVYVLYQRTSPTSDYTGYAHEMGHALHFASVDPARSYTDRYLIPASVAELFSTLLETLAVHPRFLVEEADLPPAVADDLARRERFLQLYFLTFYGANALFKLRYWTEQPDMDGADALYAALYRELVGLPMPGRYWQTHHVVALYDVYAPSYLIARVRTEELWAELVARFGPTWWREAAAGAFLREALMGPGRAVRLDAFSRLDPTPYLRSLELAA